MDKKTLLQVNAVLFGLGAVVHLYRLVSGFPLMIGNWMAPKWVSVIAVILAGYLCWQNWKAVK